MAPYWKRSRVTKALADAARAASFAEAEARLDAVGIDVLIGRDQLDTPAGQAAALTAVATAHKCFGRVTLVAANDAPLIAPLPLGGTLLKAARRLGARVTARPSASATHSIRIGSVPRAAGWDLRCWWDRWLSGARAYDDDAIGDLRLALSGVFSGAVAVRQVFACVLAGRDIVGRDVTLSLWMPWASGDPGPLRFDVPDKLWLLGLGHLGQAYVWNLCLLPGTGECLAVLQDDQSIGEENEATSSCAAQRPSDQSRKTRLAAPWLEACGWRTELIERRHCGDIVLTEADPPYLLSGLDRLKPRLILARHGFPYMLDAGIGHGAGDFEGIQLRTVAKGQALEGFWSNTIEADDSNASKNLLNRPAYKELEQEVGQCGTVGFAEAGVAVPFVGAAAGAITVAQLIRLGRLEPTPLLLQIELGAPEMASFGGTRADAG